MPGSSGGLANLGSAKNTTSAVISTCNQHEAENREPSDAEGDDNHLILPFIFEPPSEEFGYSLTTIRPNKCRTSNIH